MFPVRGETAHLAWYQSTEAPPEVAFLHGFTDSAACWAPLIAALPEYASLAIDARGHGESGLPEEPIGSTANRDDAALVLSERGRDGGLIVVGHSMGASTAAAVAATRPDLVRAVVLEDPPPGDPNVALRRESMPDWLAELRALDLTARIERCRLDDPAWPQDELEPWAVSKAQVNAHMVDLLWESVPPLTDRLAAITCPVLLLHGDTDRGSLISPEYARRCAEAAAGEFRAVRIEGAGHSVRRDNRPRFLAELTEFLARHR